MVVTAERVAQVPPKSGMPVIDGDIHPTLASKRALDPYFLDERWLKHHQTYGSRSWNGSYFPRAYPGAARVDSWPPTGGPAGSDLDFMREQLLDRWNIEHGVLQPLLGAGGERNVEYGHALAQAINEWQIHEWMEKEPRLRSGIVVPYEDARLSVKELERRGSYPGFVQIMMVIRTSEPLGRHKYWPMYEAAEAMGLPLGIHVAGQGGHPVTGAGWPSYYLEDHAGMSMAFQAQVASLILEGVFEQFPRLKVILVEGGFGWVPPLAWRMDAAWKKLRSEVPTLKRKPSEYFEEHFWLTTQPMEEPPIANEFVEMLEQAPWLQDKLMFASDYPHWDFDAPDEALPNAKMPDGFVEKLMYKNARKLYGLGPAE
ncbi:MAG: amidohydrolase family protein [Chloroflexota bacterium]